MYGDDGNDSLYGGDGKDRLEGAKGHDRMQGGDGKDHFVFTKGDDRNLDFKDNCDTVVIDDALWKGKKLSNAEILDFAHVAKGNVIFEFKGGHSQVIEGLTNIDALKNDLQVI